MVWPFLENSLSIIFVDILSHHKIHHLKVFYPVVFSKVTRLYNCHCCLIPEEFLSPPKENPYSLAVPLHSPPTPSPLAATNSVSVDLGAAFCEVKTYARQFWSSVFTQGKQKLRFT